MTGATRGSSRLVVVVAATLLGGCTTTMRRDEAWRDVTTTRAIERKLALDPLASATRVDVKVNNRVATLIGEVESEAERERARELAASVPGVVGVRDELVQEVPFGGPGLDAWISMRITLKLAGDPTVLGRNVDVEARNGVVVLTGIVESSWARGRIEEIAHTVPHVRDVENLLTVDDDVT